MIQTITIKAQGVISSLQLLMVLILSGTQSELGKAICRLTCLAYPAAPSEIKVTLGRVAFIDALVNSDMCLRIKQSRLRSLNDVIRLAIESGGFYRTGRRGELRMIQRTIQRLYKISTLIKTSRSDNKDSIKARYIGKSSSKAKLEAAKTSIAVDFQEIKQGNACYNCDENGHIRSNCPKCRNKGHIGTPIHHQRKQLVKMRGVSQ